MKKMIFAFLVSIALISCDKNAIQQTSDSIKNADSLLTKANIGLQTLDSISKTINDSDGIAQKVIIPEIEKQKKVIDSTIKNGGYQIDSINKEIEKITKNVVVGTDVVKTLDSANSALQNGESALKVLTRTADKILNQTKRQNSAQNNSSQSRENTTVIPPIVEKNPLVKTSKIEIEVDDITDSKDILREKVRENNAAIISENYSEKEGFQREYVSIKVPIQNFDQLVSMISSQVGNLKSKESIVEGSDYVSGQMGDVEITLVQTENQSISALNKDFSEEKSDSFSSQSSNAFMDGFKVLGTVMLAILPFWPLFLIGGIIWYFIRRNKKIKEEKAFQTQQLLDQQKISIIEEKPNVLNENEEKNSSENTETDYSKYLPKR